MRILITNDDGIWAPGLKVLVNWAKTLGEVVIAAPKVEQSAKSHAIELRKAFEVKEVKYDPEVTAYSIDSTPADCVRYMILGRREKFDMVFSGINKGLNIGQDILYSGTVAAIFEAACLGMKAIAFSTVPDTFATAEKHLQTAYDFVMRHDLLSKNDLYNINIPGDVKGIRITRQGGPFFSDDFPHVGDNLHMPTGRLVYVDQDNDHLDTDATQHGYISISPMTTNRVNMPLYKELRHIEE